jgi:hypothetical protein
LSGFQYLIDESPNFFGIRNGALIVADLTDGLLSLDSLSLGTPIKLDGHCAEFLVPLITEVLLVEEVLGALAQEVKGGAGNEVVHGFLGSLRIATVLTLQLSFVVEKQSDFPG